MNQEPSSTIRILLVDDHAIVREGYRALLQKQARLTVVAEAEDGAHAYQLYRQHQPDIVVMDISLPGQSGLKALDRIRQFDADARIVVFSMHQNLALVAKARRAGAMAYITKSSDPLMLIRAIFDAFEGKHNLSPDIAMALAVEQPGEQQAMLEQLTVREFEVLRLLLETKTAQQISEILNISPKTVANAHYIIKRKLGVSSDIELTRLGIKLQLVNLSDLIEEAD